MSLPDTLTLAQLLTRGAEAHPDRDCVVLESERATYGELYTSARKVSQALATLGVKSGDRVGILMPNCLDFASVLFGASLLGAIPVLYNARFKAREIAHVTNDASIKVIVTNDRADEHTNYIELLNRALPGLADRDAKSGTPLEHAPSVEFAVALTASHNPGYVDSDEFYSPCSATHNDVSEPEEINLQDIALIMYTSGTTSMPKGCPLSHIVLQHAGVVGGIERLGLVERDVMWNPLPMFHTAFTQPLTGILYVGGTLVSMARFEADKALEMIATEAVTAMFPAFPLITTELINNANYSDQSFKNVRTAVGVGPTEMLQQMQDRMPYTTLINVYGMTEFGGSLAMCKQSDTSGVRTRCSGKVLNGNEIEIRDPDIGAAVATGQLGEIVARGRGVFSGYFGAQAMPSQSFYEEGWFRTGDLGSLDVHGNLTYSGRLKEMMKVGGENVAAVEVEGFLATHPAVSIAQVVPVADEKYGEVPAAFIELAAGKSATEQEIISYCTGEIASFKIPRYVRFVDSWPKGATKILKSVLQERIREDLEA